MAVQGAALTLTATFTNPTGALVDPSLPVLNLITPAGVLASPIAATRVSVGLFTATFTPAMSGQYTWWFSAAAGVKQDSDVINVEPATSGALVSMSQVKDRLNITDSDDDAELRGKILAASRLVTSMCGDLVPTVHTDTVWPSNGSLVLPHFPVLAVTAVSLAVSGYTTVDTTALIGASSASGVVPLTGVTSSVTGSLGASWYRGPFTVTYTAGLGYVPAELQEACLEIVAWLWDTQRGVGQVPGAGEVDMAEPGFPARARALMDDSDFSTLPGIA